jgi:hypothetical protein
MGGHRGVDFLDVDAGRGRGNPASLFARYSNKSGKMSTPHDHHFIPAFYLGKWCADPTDDSSKLVEYSIPYRDKLIAKPVGRRARGFERDLYAFPELPPDQAQAIEQRFFDYADRVASAALQKLLAGDNRWTSEMRSAWSRFVIGVHLRHPDAISELRAAARAAWSSNGEEFQREYELIREPDDPPTFDERIAKIDPLVPIKLKANVIIKAIDNPNVCGHVNKMIWGIIDVSAATHRLLTSDRPVILSKLKDLSGSIMMPISPTKLFVAVNDGQWLHRLRAVRPRDIVARANRQTVERARRFVWAEDSSQTSFIEKHMSKKLEPLPRFPNLGRYPASVAA